MNKLKYVTDIFLDEFSTNFKSKYLGLYLNNDADEIKEIFSNPQNIRESSFEFEFQDLILESDDPEANVKNVKIIWESLKNLTVAEAENEKVWIALENTYYLNYHLDQLNNISGKNREASIIARTIFNRGKKRSLMINSIASLWWIAYYTYDEKSSNPYYYTEKFLSGSYRGNSVAYFSSNLVSNKEIVLGTLGAIYELIDEGKMIENRYSYSNANKILNLVGGVIMLDSLSRDEVKEIVKSNLLDSQGIKLVKK